MSLEREIIKRLNESRRLDEAFPPILNSLMPHEKTRVRTALTKAGVDIENTPYEIAVITNGRDPRLQGKNVVIFELSQEFSKIAVWFNGEFLVDVYVYEAEKNLSKMSWKNILTYAKRITVMKFDEENAKALKMKKDERSALKKSATNVRYTQKNKPKYVTLDKSGYIVDPKKYQKMLATMKLGNATKVLQDAKDLYVKLANNIDKIDFTTDRGYYNYEQVMREMLSIFQSLTSSLKKYEDYQKKHPNFDDTNGETWWYDSLKDDVIRDIQKMGEITKEAKKYL